MNSIQVKQADWTIQKNEIKIIRTKVFIEEQHVPEDMEWDLEDKTACHCLAYKNNQAIAYGRLQTNGQLGRMAVLKAFRNQGVGSMILKFLINYHQSQSSEAIIIHAQSHAVKFYQQFGFVKLGKEFLEAGIPHYTMTLRTDNK